MQSDIPSVPLGELFDFGSGLSKSADDFGFGSPFISFKDVFYNIYLPNSLRQLVNSTEEEQEKHSVKRGDVLLTRTSETSDELGMSSVALSDFPKATFNGFTKRLRPKPGTQLCPEYLAYAFRSPQFRSAVTSLSSMSTRASLNNEMLSRLTIPLPSLKSQERIGSFLICLDRKIELNRRMNETLEEMARTIFRSWFVDFDPVRIKARGGDPVKELGISPEIAALFPDSFEESELGDIPTGWQHGIIRDLCDRIINGSTPSRSRSEYWEGGSILWFTTSELQNEWLLDSKQRITVAGLEGSSARELPARAVLMAIYAAPTVGRLGILASPGTFNQACTGLVANPSIGPWFLFESLAALNSWFNQRANGAAQQNISKSIVEEGPAVIPSPDVVSAFNEEVRSLFELRLSLARENQSLADTRDYLLPRLLSGTLCPEVA